MRPHSKATIDPRSPTAWGICDRCGQCYNLPALKFQYEWRGSALVNIGVRVCYRCMDVPDQHNRTLKLPPDPVPVSQPRTRFTDVYNRSFLLTQDNDELLTEDDEPLLGEV